MKLFKKMAVLAAALMLLSVFVSCDNNAEEAGDGIVAEFNGYVNKFAELPRAAKVIEPDAKVTFYDDNTFKVVAYESFLDSLSGDGRAAEKSAEIANGTYEGTPDKDGKVKITFENAISLETLELVEIKDSDPEKTGTVEIKDGKFYFIFFDFVRVEE